MVLPWLADNTPFVFFRCFAMSSTPVISSLPVDKELVLKVIPMPSDTNSNGDIFGGWVMAQVDKAAAVLATRVVQGRVATVAVKEFIFKHPVRVGDLLSFYSSVVRVGRTSVTVDVEVFAESLATQGRYVKVTEAVVTYVAIDEHGQPRPIATAGTAPDTSTGATA